MKWIDVRKLYPNQFVKLKVSFQCQAPPELSNIIILLSV
jgi:hypothetical protein